MQVIPNRVSGKRGENDANANAAAIVEAVSRPNMRFVPIEKGERFIYLSRSLVPAGNLSDRARFQIGN
jgi:hypothetical protein